MNAKTLIQSGTLLLLVSIVVLAAVAFTQGTGAFGHNAAGTTMTSGAALAGVALVMVGILRTREQHTF